MCSSDRDQGPTDSQPDMLIPRDPITSNHSINSCQILVDSNRLDISPKLDLNPFIFSGANQQARSSHRVSLDIPSGFFDASQLLSVEPLILGYF